MSYPKMYNMKLAFAMINMLKNNTNYERKLCNAIKNKCRDHCYKDSSSTKSYSMFSVLQTTVRKSHHLWDPEGQSPLREVKSVELDSSSLFCVEERQSLGLCVSLFLICRLDKFTKSSDFQPFQFFLSGVQIYNIFWRPVSLTPYRIIILMTKSCKVL